jgi:hypothetical protein
MDMSVRILSMAVLGALAITPAAGAGKDGRQNAFDLDGARMASGWGDGPVRGVRETRVQPVVASAGWRPVTDGQMRERCGGCAPAGYRFHRSVEVDLDRDGRLDLVEMVSDGRQDALRVKYAAGKMPPVLILRSSQSRWSDQGLFAVKRHSFLVNQPEVNAYVVRQRGHRFFVSFMGD